MLNSIVESLIHGTRTDPDRTWTTNGVNWLKDPGMLPSAVPYAKIMRLGYKSAWLGRDAIQQRLPVILFCPQEITSYRHP